MKKRNVIIMGAAGRDFHNFNSYFRGNSRYNVVCFTATQIPGISGRRYPKVLAGKGYPKGIPIFDEKDLGNLIKKYKVDEVYFSYSDVTHEYVMHKASLVEAAGASFVLLGPKDTQIASKKPVISICAVRTGAGKSPTTQKIAYWCHDKKKKIAVIRHPMPYGDLAKQAVQRFATYKDLKKYKCTIEEREEYEPYIEDGIVVYAGVDYEKILRQAEKEADIILWDGGNNDFPFYKDDLSIVIVDPHRAGHELLYYPGEINFRRADVLVVNKIKTADKKKVKLVMDNIKKINPKAKVVKANSNIVVEKPSAIKKKKVIVVEDGPTLTHGGMGYGAGYFAAKKYGCTIVDPRKYAVGSLKKMYDKFTHLGKVLPAMGYSDQQRKELQTTINKAKCDAVIIATPIDLSRLLHLNKPSTRVRYYLEEIGKPKLIDLLRKVI